MVNIRVYVNIYILCIYLQIYANFKFHIVGTYFILTHNVSLST